MTTNKSTIHTKDVKEYSKEDALELAYTLERYDAIRKQMLDKLKAYVTLNGPVETKEKVWGFVPAYKWNFMAQGLQKLHADIALDGKNPFDYFSFGANDAKKLGWSEQILSQYGTKTPANPTFKAVNK